MITAKYDLSTQPTTFDFAAWAVIAKTEGCDHVRFVIGKGMATDKYSAATGWKRFGNIVVPICNLAGMTFSVGDEGDGFEFPYSWGDVERCFREKGRIEVLDATHRITREPYVTISLRNSFRNIHRNSDSHEWEKFKGYLERRGRTVVVLDECERAPLDVEHRMALYHGAVMNFGVNNGPMSLCAVSQAPYMIFNIIPKRKAVEKTYDVRKLMTATGFPEGSQFSFRNDQQLLVWEPDDYELMVNAYEKMFDEKRIAA